MFNDYPITIGIWFSIGVVFLAAFYSFSNTRRFKFLAITGAAFSFLGYFALGFYNSYVGFGHSFGAVPYIIMPSLLTIALHSWYILCVVKHVKGS